MNTNIILAFGGRDYDDSDRIYKQLDRVYRDYHMGVVAHGDRGVTPQFFLMSGGARGADTLALCWARDRELNAIRVPARWGKMARSAGMERNRRMLEMALQLRGPQGKLVAVGFPGGIGTSAMMKLCQDAYKTHGGMHGAMWVEDLRG